MLGMLKTIEVDWREDGTPGMYPQFLGAGVVIGSSARTAPTAREGP